MTTQDSLKPIARHHHFRINHIDRDDRVARLEAMVVAELVGTDVPDLQRDSSIAWELKHQAAVTQFARLLAAKRGLDVELGAVGALLHDIYTVRTGSYVDHARRGGPVATEFLESVGGFSDAEVEAVLKVVVNHSDKQVISEDSWEEFGKDVDILDCFLYPHALDEYLLTKPLNLVRHYLSRAKAVWAELGVPPQPGFASLDDYEDDAWLGLASSMTQDDCHQLLQLVPSEPELPPFAIVRGGGGQLALLTTANQPPLTRFRPHTSSSVDLKLPAIDEVLLIWPGICRYERMDRETASSKQIDVEDLGL